MKAVMNLKVIALSVVLGFTGFSMVPASGDEQDDKVRVRELERRLETLEERNRMLERRMEEQEKARAKAAEARPTVSIGASGFSMRSADTNFVLRLRGLLQVDTRTFVNDGGIKDNDTITLRRARPILEGTVFRDFDFLFVPEFGGSGSPSIRYAYLNYRYEPALQLRAGKFKVPVGLEQLQSDYSNLFIERSLVSSLAPSADLGLQLHGEMWLGAESDTRRLGGNGVFNYAIGVFNGVGDGRTSSNIDFDDEKTGVGRIFIHPLLKTELKPLRGLGLGIAGSYGNEEGAAGLPLNNGYATDGFQQFFKYRTGSGTSAATANVIADGAHWRISPQGYYYYGPFGLIGEYTVSSQKLRHSAGSVTFRTVHNTAWQVGASYVLTGDDASHKGVIPSKNFDPRQGAWGAFEVVGRFAYLDVDNEVFPLLADPATSATRAAMWGVGLNWYLNKNIQASFNFIQTDFKSGAQGNVTRQNENVFLTRFQLLF